MDNKKIVWLASYPKSGNTWFRAFLTALKQPEHKVDINNLNTGGIFSGRDIFNNETDLESRYLYDEEAKNILPEVYKSIARHCTNLRFIKVHDALLKNTAGQYIIPEESTKAAIYFIRNPLDIASSLANHNGETLDEAISYMNNSKATLVKQSKNFNIKDQFSQLLLSWSEHVESWTTHSKFPVLVIRYEDMLHTPLKTFNKAITFLNISSTASLVAKAIEATTFEKLQTQEKQKGFLEKNANSKNFFRNGKAGNWKNELHKKQIDLIISHHKIIMERYNYF